MTDDDRKADLSMKKLIIFDFDGTLTDAEQEGSPFRKGYLDDIAALSNLDRDQVEVLATQYEQEVAENPGQYGWVFQGQIVAPATVDPYLRMMPVARKILDHAQALMNATDRERVLDRILYKYNYQKTIEAFRDHCGECLQALLDREMYIVTNSHTDAVQNKLRSLDRQRKEGQDTALSLLPLIDRVYGRAQKYVIDHTFDQLPVSLDLPGLERPVLLRRKHYFTVLNQLREKAGVEWSDVWVFGDIFELDLSVPLSLGAQVGLMVNRFTPQWEKDYLQNHPRGYLLDELKQVLDLIELD